MIAPHRKPHRLTDYAATRPNRVFLLLGSVWVINLFDLAFTLLAARQRLLFEANPLAVPFFKLGPAAVIGYKLVMLSIGTAIFWALRRHALVEYASWGITFCCVVLALLWYQFYLSINDSLVLAMINMPDLTTEATLLSSGAP